MTMVNQPQLTKVREQLISNSLSQRLRKNNITVENGEYKKVTRKKRQDDEDKGKMNSGKLQTG